MLYYYQPKEEVLNLLKTNPKTGLSESTALSLLEKHGRNKLKEKKKKSMFRRFLEQFNDVMILILLAAAAISFVIACVEQNPKEFFEPLLILLIVILNAVMGVLQESKAEKALDAL
ncbi:MAG: ATPase, partial [Clostridia bacterium]|nr:ATPase [Clostridia bacterium]